MRKKLIFSLLFGFLLLFSASEKSFAVTGCVPTLGGTLNCGSQMSCATNSFMYCCDTLQHCLDQQAADAPPTIPPTTGTSGCTSVPSNQTTCTGTQLITCSQPRPPAGNIERWCCSDQPSCDAAKAVVQQQITNQFGGGGTSTLCGNGTTGIDTAIGCIPVLDSDNGVNFMGWVLGWSVGIGGGIAFLLIVYGGFMVMTSQGSPERIKAGQELITSAISGLILLILSVYLLKFIGVDILGLGVFGFGT